MSEVLYASGNKVKFRQAQEVCKTFGITLIQDSLNVPEIQGEIAEPIARDKAEKAFAKFQRPVIISDDSWIIPGLNGFPGAYMKSVNDWFTVGDWLHLTRPLKDRRIILRQIVVYQDENGQHLFSCNIEGIILLEARGDSADRPSSAITSFDNGKHSNAEFEERSESPTANLPSVWHDFAEWYSKNHPSV
jgi:non-canonical purine NTP pyrophosphatase (RdgB/HAM1 family)